MNKIFVNNVGDLAEAQRASYYHFLFYGIGKELINFPNPFKTRIRISKEKREKKRCSVFLYINDIRLNGPQFTISDCLIRDMTYSIQLYVPSTYSYLVKKTGSIKKRKSRKRKPKNTLVIKKRTRRRKLRLGVKRFLVKQDLFFGEVPLMTEEGTFVINGCERIVISQIIRSPGVYLRKEFGKPTKTVYTATIISDKGLWTKFIVDEQKEKKKQKGESKEDKEKREIENAKPKKERIYIKLNDFKSKSYDSRGKEKDDDSDSNKIFIFDLLRFFGLNFKEITDSLKYPLHLSTHQLMGKLDDRKQTKKLRYETIFLIKRFFFNQRSGCFSIGEIGRYKINKKLNLNLPKDITYLTAHDFLGIIDGLFELKYYDRTSDDIDDIKNKQIRSVGDLLQNQIRVGLYRLKKSVRIGASLPMSQKVQFEAQTYSGPEPENYDPNQWIIDPRPLTSSVKEFFKTSQLSQFMDQVNPLAELTHKRRVSVFGPNGLKRDHISTVIRDIHPSQYGRLCPIETPEGQNAGLITSLAMYGRIGSLGSIETPYFFMKDGKVFSDKSPIYLNPEQESETRVAFCDISLSSLKTIKEEYLSVKENSLFSVKKVKDIDFITTSPLQIVSLATSLIPFLEHDDANRALMGSNMQRQAVPLLYPQKPIIGTGLESVAILDSGMVIKTYSEGIVKYSSAFAIKVTDKSGQTISYYLRKYYRSNQETAINQRPIVWIGEKVFSSQVIADGPSTHDGELSLGKNLTIAYMPWEGYNYEDAIVINERVVLNNALTSVHIEEYETKVTYSIGGSEKLTKDIPHSTEYIRRHLKENGVVAVGSYVKEHDILVGKLTPCEEDPSPEANLLRALYPEKKKEPNYRDTSLRVAHGTEGRIIEVHVLSSSAVFLFKENPIENPVENQAGNQIESSNESQIESSTENIEGVLKPSYQRIRIYIAQIRKLQVGDKLAGRHGNKGIVSRIVSAQDMPYLPDGTPVDIIFNPLGVPSRMNVGQVFECLLGFAGEKLGKRFKISPFDEVYGKEASRILVNQKLKEAAIVNDCNWIFNSSYPGKILLRDGRTGEYFDNPVTVGKTYILKLVHLVEDKIHARATGPYSMITEQPLAGKSQRGGQRFGEMEVWALEAYGCSNTLQELLTIKSDDIDGRNDMYEAISIRKKVKKPTPSIPESFLALIRELNALGLDFGIKKFEGALYSTTDSRQIEKDIFKEIEIRLKLRALLARKKAQEIGSTDDNLDDNPVSLKLKEKEQEERIKTLERFYKQQKREKELKKKERKEDEDFILS